MKHRKLRIAWSVGSGVACVMLLVLWVRSYRAYDVVGVVTPAGDEFSFHSTGGYLGIILGADFHWMAGQMKWRHVSGERDRDLQGLPPPWLPHHWRESFGSSTDVPHWMLFVLIALCGAIPWLRSRFSLRTLLIATTLVGVGLGLIAISI